ncbi:MAG TPA: hypothetical protein VGS06_00685 [Streptosporangiaceae bacterium]|nr:hypothetical protein [Streptosporangiaceae bacterium]
MQPLAVVVLVSGGLVVPGVVVMLILTRRDTKPGRVTVNRWNRHGSLPLSGAGIVIGVISHGGGQSPVTHDVVYAVAAALLLAALLCALVGAAVASTARSGLRG